MSRYLVTGCAGFIGSHLAHDLLERGHDVVGVDSFTDYYPRSLKESNAARARGRPGFSLREVDLADAELDRLLDGVDGVFHLAAQPGVRGSWGDGFGVYLRDNVLATQRLFQAVAGAGMRVVMASTSSIYGNAARYPTREDTPLSPISPYGVTKLACERLAECYAECFGLDAVGLRYFTVYGPSQRPDMAFARITAALVKGEPFTVYGTGEQSRDFTYVGDAVSATIAAMEHAPAGRVYNVGGGSEASLRAVIAIFEHLSSRMLDVRYTEAAAGDVRRTAADTTRIRGEVGWEPKTSLEAGLAAQLADAFDRAGDDAPRTSFLEVLAPTGNNPTTGQPWSSAK